MITIATTLNPENVRLNLQASDAEDAVAKLAAILRNDERVLDWQNFLEC